MKYTKPNTRTNIIYSVLCILAALCVFMLPVGCADTSESAVPKAISEPEDTFVYSTDMPREINADGTVTMRYNNLSNSAADSAQTFKFEGSGDMIRVEVNGGTVACKNDDGRINYWKEPETITANAGKAIYWLPQELHDFDENGDPAKFLQAKSAVITFTMFLTDEVTDTAVITITSNKTTDEHVDQMTYIIAADEGHALAVNEVNHCITISSVQ